VTRSHLEPEKSGRGLRGAVNVLGLQEKGPMRAAETSGWCKGNFRELVQQERISS